MASAAVLTGAGDGEMRRQGWADVAMAKKYVLFKCANMVASLNDEDFPETLPSKVKAYCTLGMTYSVGLRRLGNFAIRRASAARSALQVHHRHDLQNIDPFLNMAIAVRMMTDGHMSDALVGCCSLTPGFRS